MFPSTQVYNIHVACSDRPGVLHHLVESLWEADLHMACYNVGSVASSTSASSTSANSDATALHNLASSGRVAFVFSVHETRGVEALTSQREDEIAAVLRSAHGAHNMDVRITLASDEGGVGGDGAAAPERSGAPVGVSQMSQRRRLNRTVLPRMHLYSARCPADQNGHLTSNPDGANLL